MEAAIQAGGQGPSHLLIGEVATEAAKAGRPLSTARLRYFADSGRLPCQRTATGVRLFAAEDVRQFIAARARRRRRP